MRQWKCLCQCKCPTQCVQNCRWLPRILAPLILSSGTQVLKRPVQWTPHNLPPPTSTGFYDKKCFRMLNFELKSVRHSHLRPWELLLLGEDCDLASHLKLKSWKVNYRSLHHAPRDRVRPTPGYSVTDL